MYVCVYVWWQDTSTHRGHRSVERDLFLYFYRPSLVGILGWMKERVGGWFAKQVQQLSFPIADVGTWHINNSCIVEILQYNKLSVTTRSFSCSSTRQTQTQTTTLCAFR